MPETRLHLRDPLIFITGPRDPFPWNVDMEVGAVAGHAGMKNARRCFKLHMRRF